MKSFLFVLNKYLKRFRNEMVKKEFQISDFESETDFSAFNNSLDQIYEKLTLVENINYDKLA